MKKKNLFSFTNRKRKKKSKKEPISQDKKENKSIIKIKQTKKKFGDYLKKHQDKINAIRKFLLIIFGYGLVINYSLHFLLGIKFNLFTLFAWGIAYYFISDEFVEWFRRLIARR